MARYLVSAQVALSAFDMHKLGLLTHVVPESALDIILPVMSDISCLE
jgi:enoyl-CoA hydratase/carnithine racemase